MATQEANSIRITHTYPENHVRLLELPPEILEGLSSDKAQPLYLKSLPPRTPEQQALMKQGPRSAYKQEYVNLCTETKTYGVKEVQSSNSIILIRPEKDNRDATGGEEDAGLGSEDTMTVFSQCWSTLELHDFEGGVAPAASFLEKSLPVYGPRAGDIDDGMDLDLDLDEDTTSTAATRMRTKMSPKDAVLSDVPMSPAECELGWIEVCAFVHTDEKKAWRPSAKAKLGVWEKILEGSVIQGIEVDKQFLVKDLWKAVNDDDDEPPFRKELFDAVVRRLVDQEAYKPGAELKWANFDMDMTVRWVAETYLEAIAPTPETAISRNEFLNKWKDHLPEAWRDQASWANFKGGYFDYPDAASVCFSEKTIEQKRAEASKKANARATRDWHNILK